MYISFFPFPPQQLLTPPQPQFLKMVATILGTTETQQKRHYLYFICMFERKKNTLSKITKWTSLVYH